MNKTRTVNEVMQAWKDDERTALICEDKELSFAGLIRLSQRIAGALVSGGISKGERIVLCLDPGIEFVTAMFGVLYAGGVCVPVDSSWPEERIECICSDCRAVLTIKPEVYRRLTADGTGSVELPVVSGEDECCVYYTSGSTGRPKGLSVAHEVLFNYTSPFEDNVMISYTLKNCRRVVSLLNYAYSFSLYDMISSVRNGLTLIIASQEERQSPARLGECIMRNKADALSATPSMLLRYIEDETFADALRSSKGYAPQVRSLQNRRQPS